MPEEEAQAQPWEEQYTGQDAHEVAEALEKRRLLRDAGQVQQAGEIVIKLAGKLRRAGLYSLLRDLCKETLSDIGESDELLKARIGYELGNLAYLQGEYDRAHALYLESLATFERSGDQGNKALALHQLGMIAQEQGRYIESRSLYLESLAIEESLGDLKGKARSLHELGIIAQNQGDYVEARSLYQESLAIEERLEDQGGKARSLHQLGVIAQEQGEYAEARSLHQQSLALFEQSGDQSGKASSLYELGNIAYIESEYAEARSLHLESLAIKERLGDQGGRARSLYQLGMIAQEQGDLVGALQGIVQAYLLFEALQSPSLATAQSAIARIRSEIGEEAFGAQWDAVTGGRALPALSSEERQQFLQELALDFMKVVTWEDARRFVEVHPGLLQPEMDALLQELAAQVEDADSRDLVEGRRLLLIECRDEGIEATFAKYQGE